MWLTAIKTCRQHKLEVRLTWFVDEGSLIGGQLNPKRWALFIFGSLTIRTGKI